MERPLRSGLPIRESMYPTREYSVICLYGWVAARYEVPEEWLATGILWSWLDNQMLVAAKAIPLGQNALQAVLADLKP